MKFVLSLRKFNQISLAVAVICIFAGCDLFNGPAYRDTGFIVRGEVAITRNGMPYNYDEYLPSITAFNEKGELIGGTNIYVNNYQTITWLGNGRYKWDINLSAYRSIELPCKVYFRVSCRMYDIMPYIEIEDEFLVDYGTSTIELGNINYDIARLYGNLPVTVNGSNSQYAIISVRLPDGKGLFDRNIQPNGDWSRYIDKPVADTSFLCSIRVGYNGGQFRKTLPNVTYSVHDNDIEFIFPDYPNGINLEAITLSGTIKTLIKNEQPVTSYVMFFLNTDDQIGSKAVRFLQPNGDGSADWNITLPAFSFPQELLVLVTVINRDNDYQTWSSIHITNNTDLNNIDLGVFTE
jgi:hypothetical protein